MKKDVIRLRNMVFHGYHGVWDAEQQIGQRFQIDLEIYGDISTAGESDLLKDTIDLYEVHQVVEAIVTGRKFKLIEALAEHIAATLISKFDIPELMVRVRKPNSPIRGISEGIEVEIVRSAEHA